MSNFKKLNSKIYQKPAQIRTPDYIYWKQLSAPVLVKEFGPVDYIDFSPIEPHFFAVTCSVRVQIYNPITKLVNKNLSRFRESAYGGTFRSDGKLLCAGSEETNVKLFDISSKSLLRLFKGHVSPVHRVLFLNNKPQISSFSDDKTVKVWDIPTEKQVLSYSEHSDYVRAGATCIAVPDIILSGGYDGYLKMYDTRSDRIVTSVCHGSPIESLLYLPSGGIFLSAGSTDIKIWDSVSGGKLLGTISQHHKTITCLRLSTDNKRLLSAGLDRHVNVYDISTFKVVHTLDYPNAVLSLGVSKNDDTVVAGLVDGLVCISRREDQISKKSEKKVASYKYVSHSHVNTVDTVVSEFCNTKESKIDHCLRKFRYSKALDFSLLPYVANKTPHVTISLMQELIRRHALHRALKARDSKFLLQFLRFLLRNITDYRFTKVLVEVFHCFLDVYENNIHLVPVEIKLVLQNISKLLSQEVELTRNLSMLHGSISMIMSAANTSEESTQIKHRPHNLMPSENAQKSFVVNLT